MSPLASSSGSRVVAAVCTANVIISIVSTCLYYNQLWALQGSPAFALQLGCLQSVIVCFVSLVAIRKAECASAPGQHVKARVWLELASWFAMQATVEIAAIDGLGPHNGSLIPVLQQAIVPMTMLISVVLLGRRFGAAHWAAVALIIGGITASYAPTISTAAELRWG